VYVLDFNRIQKFTINGNFILKWGSEGDGESQVKEARGIAIDSQNNVYVADAGNYRIQKFTADGTFITEWGCKDPTEGEFNLAVSIAIDSSGNVYAVSKKDQLSRIHLFGLTK
jgi:DNA-binding beta-propeller fold protein YncE